MNELARFREQYDDKLVNRLTDQIDGLQLDITELQMKNKDLNDEASYLRKDNLRLKTDFEMK
jgi:FtsZ-binding cell division protein ZapB